MTLNDAIIKLYEGTDEQSDRVPYNTLGNVDLTLVPTRALMESLKEALRIVSTWRTQDGRRLRFKMGEGEKMYLSPATGREASAVQMGYILDAASPVCPSRVVILPATFSAEDDFYKGWTIALGGLVGEDSSPLKTSIVMSSTGSTLTLVDVIQTSDIDSHDLPQMPFTLHPRCVPLSSLGLEEYIAMRSLADMNTKTDLTPTKDFSYGLSTMGSISVPTSYRISGSWVYFDACLPEQRVYLVRYWKYPELPGVGTEELPLPGVVHEAIVLIAKWMEFRRIGQTADGLECWRGAAELLNRIRTDNDIERDSYHGTLTGRLS